MAFPESFTHETRTLQLAMQGGILYARTKRGVEQTPADARANLAAGLELTGGRRVPVILDGRDSEPVSVATRQEYDREGLVFAAAVGLIADSTFARIIGNLFMRITSMEMPQRIFSTVEEAEVWLRSVEAGGLREP